MKKLLLAVLLSTSAAFGCNDLPKVHGHKLGCEIDTSDAIQSVTEKGLTYHMYENDKFLVTQDGILILVATERFVPYKHFQKMLGKTTLEHGMPRTNGTWYRWDVDGITMTVTYDEKKTTITYGIAGK